MAKKIIRCTSAQIRRSLELWRVMCKPPDPGAENDSAAPVGETGTAEGKAKQTRSKNSTAPRASGRRK